MVARYTLFGQITAGHFRPRRPALFVAGLACFAALQAPGPAAADTTLWARVELERSSAYVQESFPVTIALYYRDTELGRHVQLEGLPREGFEWSTFQELAATRMQRNGHIYQVRRFRGRGRALTPGKHSLAPTLHVHERVRDQSRWRGHGGAMEFFTESVREKPRSVSAEPMDLEIAPLPDAGRPGSFSGAVGRFTFAAEIDRPEAAVGEPVALRMTLIGEGNPDLVRAPEIEADTSFRVHEPRLVERDFDPARGVGKKVFETVLVPRTSRITEIPAVAFSFFDPAQAAYETLWRGPFPLHVLPGMHTPKADTLRVHSPTAGPHTDPVGKERLRDLKPAPRRWSWDERTSNIRGLGNATAYVVPLFVGTILAITGRRRTRRETDPAYAQRIQATRLERRALQKARHAAHTGDAVVFFDSLGTALSARYGIGLNLPPGNTTSRHMVAAAAKAGIDPNTCEELQRLLDRVDVGRFGGAQSTADEMKSLLNTAHELGRKSVYKAQRRFRAGRRGA